MSLKVNTSGKQSFFSNCFLIGSKFISFHLLLPVRALIQRTTNADLWRDTMVHPARHRLFVIHVIYKWCASSDLPDKVWHESSKSVCVWNFKTSSRIDEIILIVQQDKIIIRSHGFHLFIHSQGLYIISGSQHKYVI